MSTFDLYAISFLALHMKHGATYSCNEIFIGDKLSQTDRVGKLWSVLENNSFFCKDDYIKAKKVFTRFLTFYQIDELKQLMQQRSTQVMHNSDRLSSLIVTLGIDICCVLWYMCTFISWNNSALDYTTHLFETMLPKHFNISIFLSKRNKNPLAQKNIIYLYSLKKVTLRP